MIANVGSNAPIMEGPREGRGGCIVGTGEMAERVRRYDWQSTPLGPIDTWSRELVATVNLTLNSAIPSRTLWGPDLIVMYNDSYRRLLGNRHPGALGSPAREVYLESWNAVGPALEKAFETGQYFGGEKLSVRADTEQGTADLYLDYSFSPVFERGMVAGLFGTVHDVTRDVLAIKTLRNNEACAQLVLQSIGDAVIVTDAKTQIVQMNPVAEALTGWRIGDAVGRPLGEVIRLADESTCEAIESPAEKILREHTVVGPQQPAMLLCSSGDAISVDHSGAPILDDQGHLTGIALVFRNVHDRRAAERERSALARQLALVLDATTDGVLSVDRSWTLVYCNRRAQEMLKASGELTGRKLWDVFPEAVFEGSPFITHYYRAMEERVPGSFEAFYGGQLNAWFSINVQPAEHGIVIFFRDITAQRQEREALRERESKLKAIYSTSLEYIGLITPDGILIDCNRASLEFGPSQREDVVGKHFADTVWFVGTAGAPDVVRRAIAAANAGETFRTELHLLRPNGETLIFDFSLTPVRDESGKIVHLVPEMRDITGVKRTEGALLKSEKLASVGRLASSIAHEINNPLESVMNLIFLAQQSGPGEAKTYLDMADQEIRRVSIIANQTLRFHKQAANPQAVTAADLFSTVMSIYEGRLRNANVKVEKDFRTREPVVCFQGDVRQVLNNLVSNALEAMPFGGRLLIRSRKGRNWKTGQPGLVLTIADNGSGIPPSILRHIFDAFFTTKGTAGNGLGLWVCQEIVARHHGALRVRSCQSPGRNGTTFTLFLPFEPPSPS